MNVILDVNSLVANEITGIGIYVLELATRLQKMSDINMTGGIKFSRLSKLKQLRKNYKGKLCVNEFLRFQSKKYDIFHGPDFRVPKYLSMKKVMTIHDVVTFRSGFVDPRFEESGRNELICEIEQGRPDAIITVSNFTKNELLEFFPDYKNRIHVVYQGFQHEELRDKKYFETRFGELTKAPFILFVGTLEKRKNVLAAVEAFEQFADIEKNVNFVLVGGKGFQGDEVLKYIESSRHKSRIIRPGYIQYSELFDFYAKAQFLFLPSLYEGFCLPLLEAMSQGCPIVTSNRGAMLEVTDGAAVYTDPNSVDQMTSDLLSTFKNDQLRGDLRMRSQIRAKEFSWDKTAEKTLNVYKDVIGYQA